jgi:hypothetical protein
MIANSKIVGLLRYALLHLPPAEGTLYLVNVDKAYWRLVFNNKQKGPISKAGALLQRDKGGAASQSVATIQKATALSLVARMEKFPKLLWVAVAKVLLKRSKSRNTTTLKEALERL